MKRADLDWHNLGFEYLPTNAIVQADYADGVWGAPVLKTDPYITLHVAANVLHYGQTCFEGMKVFETQAGDAVLFRPEMNARRMAQSAERICMPPVPEELFLEACRMVVLANRDFLPPYGTGASLYVRPLQIGTQPTVGLRASDTYSFIVLVTPVGPYYPDGFMPVEAIALDDYDRAAPRGTGKAKFGGNYAAGFMPAKVGKKLGYPIVLFTDPAEHRYVDEFGTSNFLGITRDGKYLTPESSSILASVTNDSLQVLARDMGMEVVVRPILVTELDDFAEVGACGTAAVITPICSVKTTETTYTFCTPDGAGPVLTELYRRLQGIQYGDLPDTHGWLMHIK
jgi:branched-chain amino acid aminotransferase